MQLTKYQLLIRQSFTLVMNLKVRSICSLVSDLFYNLTIKQSLFLSIVNRRKWLLQTSCVYPRCVTFVRVGRRISNSNAHTSVDCGLWTEAELMFVCFKYPGYSVTSVVSARNGRLLVAGAPRFNHTGKVIIFTLKNSGNLTILHSLKGQQVVETSSTWYKVYQLKASGSLM